MKTQHAMFLFVTLALGLPACGFHKPGRPGDHSGPDAGGQPGGDPEFQACVASLQTTCVVSDMNTADKMGTPCASLTMIPIPLTDGTNYGPMTIPGGPYGGKTEWNQGAGTEFVNPINDSEKICIPTGIESFQQPASVNAEIENTRSIDYSLYTIFRPACMKKGETYPVITWANGTCGITHGYAPLLGTLASYGFVVIASNSTWTATAPTNTVQLRALDYAKALNEDPNSVLYQRLNLDKIGAMGHSQGSLATAQAATDPRIKALILWNGLPSNAKPFLYVSGEQDVVNTTPDNMAQATDNATQPGAWVYYHQILPTGGVRTGHLVLMEQPERVVDMTVAWWKYLLNGDNDAKNMFLGDNCGLCNRATEFEYGHNSLLQ